LEEINRAQRLHRKHGRSERQERSISMKGGGDQKTDKATFGRDGQEVIRKGRHGRDESRRRAEAVQPPSLTKRFQKLLAGGGRERSSLDEIGDVEVSQSLIFLDIGRELAWLCTRTGTTVSTKQGDKRLL